MANADNETKTKLVNLLINSVKLNTNKATGSGVNPVFTSDALSLSNLALKTKLIDSSYLKEKT